MAIHAGFLKVLSAAPDVRAGLYAQTAQRLGTSERNVEKDFWVCLTLDALFNGLQGERPRLLFKGGTSLSKAFHLIDRFSEDIDVTVFRDDIDQPGSVEELAALSGKQRKARLEAIREACAAYVAGPLREALVSVFAEVTGRADHSPVDIAPDPLDPTGQGLQLRYESVTGGDGYILPIVRIESGAKSALDPNTPQTLRPYVADDLADDDIVVGDVTTVAPERTFWDKIIILHGLRRWYDTRGELRQEGQRISRHYYDLHKLLQSPVAAAAEDHGLGADCVRHARMFFDRPDFDLASAAPGTLALKPVDGMLDRLRGDYDATQAMIFGRAPDFEDIVASIATLQARLNG